MLLAGTSVFFYIAILLLNLRPEKFIMKLSIFKNTRIEGRRQAKGTILILLACMIWGYGYVVIKDASDRIALDNLMFFRYLPAAVGMKLLFFKRNRGYSRREIRGGMAMGFLLYVSQYCQTAALRFADTTAGEVAFITALYVVFVPLIWAVFRRKCPGAADLISIILAVAGMFFLVGGVSRLTAGCLIALLGSLLFAVHILVIDAYTADCDVIRLVTMQYVFAAVFSGVFQMFHGTPLPSAADFLSVGGQLFYLSIISTMLGFLFQFAGQKYISPMLASLLLSTESIFGMLFSVLFTGEGINPRKCFGCFLMLLALFLKEARNR